jgi:Domain of unknown function (DUF4252)
MKSNLFIISALFCIYANIMQAQSPAVWAFYHNTPRAETSFKATVPGIAVKLGALFIKEKETRRLVNKVGKVRLFVMDEQPTEAVSHREVTTLVKRLKRDGFEDFLSVKDDASNVHFMIREKRGKIRGLVMLVKDDKDFVMISAKCRLRLEDVVKLIKEHGDDITTQAKRTKSKRNTKNT